MFPNNREEAAGASLLEIYADEDTYKFVQETNHVCPMCLTVPRELYQATREVYSAITLATALAGAEAWQRTGALLEDLRKSLQAARRMILEHDAAFERWQGKSPRHGRNGYGHSYIPAHTEMEGQINDLPPAVGWLPDNVPRL